MAETVYVRGTRQDVRRAIYRAAAAASGNGQSSEAATGMQVRLGMTALRLIKEAFIVKSRGETDECGLKWPPLSSKTTAYSRRHKGVPTAETLRKRRKKLAGKDLTAKQNERWWKLYRKGLEHYRGDTINASRYAWLVLAGTGTKLEVLGYMPVDILRDTGLLFNSLSPGVNPESPVMPMTPPDIEHQIFRTGRGEVIVGTNRKGAAAHHYGAPSRNLPQRRLWPEPSQWTSEWWGDIENAARTGFIDIFLHFLRNP